MPRGRSARQRTIRSIVRNRTIKTQRDLVLELRGLGFVCTQATVSRDISEMGLRKLAEGRYVLAEDIHLHRMVVEFVSSAECVSNQVLIKTQAGTAAGVAAAIDAAELTDVAGTIAGSDTVLAISRSGKGAAELSAHINKLRVTPQE